RYSSSVMLSFWGRPCSSTQVRTWSASGRKQLSWRDQSRVPAGPEIIEYISSITAPIFSSSLISLPSELRRSQETACAACPAYMIAEYVDVDIGPANQHSDALALEAVLQRAEQSGGRGRASRLDGELHFAEQNGHRVAHLIVVDHHEFVDIVAAQAEAVRQRIGRCEAVGDRRHVAPRDRFAGREAAVHGVRAFGFHAEHLAIRLDELDGGRRASAQAAAADRNDRR